MGQTPLITPLEGQAQEERGGISQGCRRLLPLQPSSVAPTPRPSQGHLLEPVLFLFEG